MGRQFGLYLLPSDAEQLLAALHAKVGLKVLQPYASTSQPVELGFSAEEIANHSRDGVSSYDCYLRPSWEAKIQMTYLKERNGWHVERESEVIEFSGCHYDGKILLRGRLYYQHEKVAGAAFVPKRKEFVDWAERIFRTAKRLLHKQPGAIYAYVGDEAVRWRAASGRFAHFRRADGEPIYDDAEILLKGR
jgi:hypothetical protein